MNRRLTATAALLLMGASVVLAVVLAVQAFPRGLSVLACILLAVGAAWWGLLRRNAARLLGFGVAALLLAGAVVIVVLEGRPIEDSLIIAGVLLSLACAREAFATRSDWPSAQPPAHPVLLYNPKSGGGKAERFDVAGEARARGIEPIELQRGDDLSAIVREAIARGADAVGMAGGDGSQAIVAGIAAEHGLPYVCVPAGTRNHFALDLGVDRDDVVGALDAFTAGRERIVDLAEVNGRIFVNNVSLGVYAEAVKRSSYRDAKLRTLTETAPDVLGPGAAGLDLRWTGPDGRRRRTSVVLLVSNDPYRLGRAIGSGTRPRLDAGHLGIAVIGSHDTQRKLSRRVQEWTTPELEVESDRTVAAGIDGESVALDPPLRFRTLPAALRVRIAPQHPGASPSANVPAGALAAILELGRLSARGSA
ncbi:MAG: diacylglycerol/lipid kinase family protein [Solirubrobacteraceae bacterium]